MPETLRQYTFLGKIGSGRLGDVFRAHDTRVGRTVAIRLVASWVADDPGARDRLLEDARRGATLSHANVAGLVEWGEEDGCLFLVFEFVPGDRLAAVIGGRPLNVRRAVDLGVQLADALAEAHALGLVHGDLRPDTIVVTPKGRPKILDFGFLSWTNGGFVRQAVAELSVVDRATVASTVAYMSSEQALGELTDHRTDIFSLGVLLHEMVTGHSPFAAETGTDTLLKILQAQPPAASTLNPLAPPSLDRVISRSLAKSLEARYDNAALMATELRQVGAEMDARAEESAREFALPKPAPRRGFVRRFLGLALVVTLLAGALWTWRAELARRYDFWFGTPRVPVLAVLPLEMENAGRERAYYAVGFTEDLTTRLAQIDGMTVLARRSIRAYRGATPADVSRETRAAVVLAGSVTLEGDEVRARLRLIDPVTSRDIWTSRFARQARDVIALEAEISEQIARAVGLPLHPNAARDRTALRIVEPAAYDLYLQGRDRMAEYDFGRAVPLLEQAVALDGTLAEAQAALAQALTAARDLSGEWTPSVSARITGAAGAAIAADPDLPAAQLAMGLAESGEPDALRYLRRAVELDPGYATGYHHIADEIVAIDPARATAFYQRALDLDLRFDETYRDRAFGYGLLGQSADATRDINAGRALNPARWWWPALLARVQFDQGRFHEGLQIAADGAQMVRSASFLLAYAGALHLDGRTREALDVVSDFRVRHPGACAPAAMLAALEFDIGRRKEAGVDARRIMEMAAGPGRTDHLYPCAAMAAAAIGDAEAVAAWIRQMAASDSAANRWFREGHHSPDAALRRGAYPWNKVAAHPSVKAASGEIEVARVRLRGYVARMLDGLLDQERGRPVVEPLALSRQ